MAAPQRPTTPYCGAAYATQEACWKCGTLLYELWPPVHDDWRYWCPRSQHLTLTTAAAEQALATLAERHPGAIGTLVSVPFPLMFTPHDPARP